MPARPTPTAEDFIRLSKLLEDFETAKNELASEVFRLFPKAHPASRFLSAPAFLHGFAGRLKSGLEDSARRCFSPGWPDLSKLFYGPDRAQAREDALDFRR
jgi:hypothetical protein